MEGSLGAAGEREKEEELLAAITAGEEVKEEADEVDEVEEDEDDEDDEEEDEEADDEGLEEDSRIGDSLVRGSTLSFKSGLCSRCP